MRAIVRKWGNSPAVRIPASVMVAAGLHIDARVEMRVDASGAVILKRIDDDFDLATALEGITPANLHDEIDFGAAAGHEAW